MVEKDVVKECGIRRIADSLERMAIAIEGLSDAIIRFLKRYEERLQKAETETRKLLEYYSKHFKPPEK